MKSFEIVIRPDLSALLVGGRSGPLHGGDRATARDAQGRLIIPASALRGALRIQLERLLAGLDLPVEACSANRPERAASDRPCDCPVCRLFGDSGLAAGTLRLEDAVLGPESGAGEEVVVRPRVAVSRRSRTAAEKLLGFFETSPLLGTVANPAIFRARALLVPRSEGDTGFDEDESNLRAACAALRGIGGSRARGLGWVRCTLEERALSEPPKTPSLSSSGMRLRFTAEAPLHFGLGPPMGYFQPTRRWAPGSAVRGSLAFALLENRLCNAEEPAFEGLFGESSQVSFGSARANGQMASVTRRKCRPLGQGIEHVFDDLVAEVLRRRAAEEGVALAVTRDAACPMPGCQAVKVMPWEYRESGHRPRVRVRTRTALNRRTGTSMDAKLFSHEVIEPKVRSDADSWREPCPLVLTAELWGMKDSACRELLAKLHGLEVWLGAKRAQGMGTCRLEVEDIEDVERAAVEAALADAAALGEALDAGWQAIRKVAGELPATPLGVGELPLAVVLTEPWWPDSAGGVDHGPLDLSSDGKPLAAFVKLVDEGRFGALEARGYGAPPTLLQGEWRPRPVVAPGSTWVYALDHETLTARLGDWLALGRRGQGVHREAGWGRFMIRGADSDF